MLLLFPVQKTGVVLCIASFTRHCSLTWLGPTGGRQNDTVAFARGNKGIDRP